MYSPLKLFLIIPFLACLCSLAQTNKVTYSGYPIDGSIKKDSTLSLFLTKYRDSVSKTMNIVIGFSVSGMSKHQPESGLGNFMTDAMKNLGEKIFKQKIDAAFVNYGGIRSYLPKGNITLGNVFEIMPFDNLLVLQKVRGDSLLSFLNHIANRNGWPVSGITMGIKEKKAVNAFIGEKAIVADSLYTIANSDYIANGGDNTSMLKPFPQLNKGILIRDVLIDYIKLLTDNGTSIDTKPEKRVIYVN